MTTHDYNLKQNIASPLNSRPTTQPKHGKALVECTWRHIFVS